MDATTQTRQQLELTGRKCRCPACGDHFNSLSAFDLHRVGEYRAGGRRCLSEAEMIAKRYSRNAAGFWVERAWRPEARELAAGENVGPAPYLPDGHGQIDGRTRVLGPVHARWRARSRDFGARHVPG
jgi:hypothetical protein